MRQLQRFVIACLVAVYYLSSAIATDGPSPYPRQAGDWPGEGVIRVFGWMKDNRETFWRQREQKQGAWVLAGDSLLGNWRNSEQDLQPYSTANRAIGGDVSRGLLFRFQQDVLDLHPSGIVLLIGGNDLSALQPTDETARNIGRMLDAIQESNPSVPVILCTLPPRDNPKAPIKHSELTRLNTSIKKLAASRDNVALLDLFPLFATPDEQPRPELFHPDRFHMSAAGYHILREALNAKLDSLPRHSI